MSLSPHDKVAADRLVLLNSDERLRLIEENVRDYAIFTLDSGGHITSWNVGGERILLFSEGEIVGQHLAVIFTLEDRAAGKVEEEMAVARETGRASDERWHLRKDGSRFWASGILTALREEDGRLRGYAKILRDMSELRRDRDRAAQVLEAINDVFLSLGPGWVITYANTRAELLLGQSRVDLVGQSAWTVFPDELGTAFRAEYEKAAAERVVVSFEAYVAPRDTWFQVRVHPAYDGLAVYFQNITARKADEAVRARQGRRAVFAAAVGAALGRTGPLNDALQECAEVMVASPGVDAARVWTLDAAGEALYLQASAGLDAGTDGPDRRVRLGETVIGRIASERRPHVADAGADDPGIGDSGWARGAGIRAFAGYPLVAADRLVGVMALYGREPLADDTVNDLALVSDALAHAILRRRTEEELRRSEEFLRTTLQSIGDGVITTDADVRVLFLNPVAERLTGWSREEAIGQHAWDVFNLIHAGTRERMQGPLARAITEGAVTDLSRDAVLIARDGVERAVEDSVAPIRDASGSVMGAVLVFRDATERRRAESEIQQLNARLQRAMVETHHRVKNNLQLIAAMIGLQTSGEGDTVPRSELDRLGANVRALGVIHDILTQEAKDGSDQQTLNVRSVLERLFGVLQQTTGGRNLTADLSDGQMPSRAATALTLVVNELVSNALKHSKGGVDVLFRVTDGAALLVVSDDGAGFPAGFDPTTASNTGLELVENVARWDLSGETSYENRAEGGARVVVTFPVPAPG